MSKRSWIVTCAVLTLALGAAVAAIAFTGDDTPAKSSARTTGDAAPGSLVVNLAGGNGTLDPAQACGGYDVGFVGNFYARLTQYGTKPGPGGMDEIDPAKIVPDFAESWTLSEDGRTYTFKLPSGVKFPSGAPVDANAVKYSFERVITTGGCGSYFVLDGLYEPPMIKTIEAPNPTTLVITLNKPNANALQDWAQPAAGIVDPSVVRKHGGYKEGVVNKWMAGHVAGNGPFLLESYVPSSRAVLVANPGYHGPKPRSSRIIVNFIGADSTLLLQARSGEADVTLGLSKQAAKSLVDNDCCNVVVNDTTQSQQILMPNRDNPPFDNKKFREALTYSVPYEQVLDEVAFGWGSLFYGPFPPLMPEFNAELAGPRAYDLEGAKRLVEESGVQTPVAAEIIINGAVPLHEKLATIVQGVWRQVGLNLTVSKLATSDFENRINSREYQMAITQDGPGVIEAGFYLGYAMDCTNAFNAAGICIPAADKLLHEARRTVDPTERQRLWDELTKLWVQNAPMIPVFAEKSVSVLNKRLKTYTYSHELDLRSWGK